MINVDLMIFDVDGTLIDSKKDIVTAVNFTLKSLGLPEKGFDEIVSYIGLGVDYLIKKSMGEENKSLFVRALPIFKDYYRNHSADYTRPYPGIVDTLEYFTSKTKVIVTNRDREFAEITLRLLGLDKYFKEIMGGDDQKCAKPMACPLNSLLTGLSTPSERVIMIGDMDLDIMAGKAAGVYTCGVLYGIGRREDIAAAKPDYMIEDISELRGIVN